MLRADNADERLSAIGHRLGLLSDEQLDRVRAKYATIEAEERRLSRVTVSVSAGSGATALAWLSRPETGYEALSSVGVATALPSEWGQCLEVRVRYRGYIDRQQRTAERAAAWDEAPLADEMWSRELTGLSREASEKLRRWRPATVGQAARIAGVSPSDVAVLLVHARRGARAASP